MATESESRQSFYKRGGKALISIKRTHKISVIDRQNKGRDDIITRKRMKLSTAQEHDNDLCKKPNSEDNKDVCNAVKCLKKGGKLKALTDLHRLFASCQSNADEFLRCEGLQSLHSCFKSYDVEILHASAWCVINLTAAASSSSALLSLAPTLMQFLKGSDGVMQELCAWGLANLAGDNPSNADVLHKQGCTDALVDLLQFSHLDNEERTKSVIFALINLARSNLGCTQCMHERDITAKLQVLLKRTPFDSALNFEIGWLLCSIYPGCDEMNFQANHLAATTRLVSDRLICIYEGQASSYKICFPFVRCLCNLIASNPSMAKVMLNDPKASKAISDLLTSASESLAQEILGLINNCMVDVCCRVLLILQPKLLSAIISQCSRNAPDITIQALQLIQTMARTSAYIDSYLLQRGLFSTLTLVISKATDQLTAVSGGSHEELFSREEETLPLEISVSVLLDLASSQPDLVKAALDNEEPHRRSKILHLLTRLGSSDIQLVAPDLAHQATRLMHLLGLT